MKDDSLQNDAPIIGYLNKILQDAIEAGASDIHFEPFEYQFRIRVRCDGLLMEYATPPLHLAPRLISRIKVMANCDIAEKRLPQDGRFKIKSADHVYWDLRVSTCPTLYGEKAVIRLLNPSSDHHHIDTLGLEDNQKKLLIEHLKRSQGMILVTGPTGSGKTVTLYTALQYLNTLERNIISIEDPVEMQLAGINQVNVNPKAGLYFSNALRAFLRQDPDVIMVGEIRDSETAEMAINAAQTGHLVLSTLHTNTALEAITRLMHMGIAPFHLASSLSLIIAQRLVRRTDKSGRIGVFEVLPISSHLREIILNGGHEGQMAQQIQNENITLLYTSGLNKVKNAITNLTELQGIILPK